MQEKRCAWAAKSDSPLMVAYHDLEWGQPLYDDQKLFELLMLECYQAGLSWEIVLNKRGAFNAAFYDYDVYKGAQMTEDEIDQLMTNSQIIRYRKKLSATINNAKQFLAIQADHGSFSNYLWSFTEGQVIDQQIKSFEDLLSQNELSQQVSRELKHQGFQFTGPVAIYSFLEAAGVINDHEIVCAYNPNRRGMNDGQ